MSTRSVTFDMCQNTVTLSTGLPTESKLMGGFFQIAIGLVSGISLGRIQDFFKGGGGYRYTSKGSRRGSNFRPNVKKPTTWAKKGGPDPLDPPPPPLLSGLHVFPTTMLRIHDSISIRP